MQAMAKPMRKCPRPPDVPPTSVKRRLSMSSRISDLRYLEGVTRTDVETLPLQSRTSIEWGRTVLADPVNLLIDHAFLEKKAANNAMELMTRWPGEWAGPLIIGWVQTMASVARDETAHLAHVVRILSRRGARLERIHKNPYANALRLLVRKGEQPGEILDRLFVSALIEARSCERFAVLAEASEDGELSAFYTALYSSELGHYKVFLKLAYKIAKKEVVDARWREMLVSEAQILEQQEPGPRIHSR
jgi:tRNA 2-(methylsulfanyl)-N6-isopentenyladenosine37 hydroxylase